MATKAIINLSLPVFCMEMEAAFEEGFRINPDNPPCTWGIAYECVLVRDDHKEAVEDVFVSGEIVAAPEPHKKSAGRPVKAKV